MSGGQENSPSASGQCNASDREWPKKCSCTPPRGRFEGSNSRRSLARFSGQESLVHIRSLAAFITTRPALGFRYTQVPAGTNFFVVRICELHDAGIWRCRPVERWQLLGPITAMNGLLLFGRSTAVIFEVLRKTMAVKASAADSPSSTRDLA